MSRSARCGENGSRHGGVTSTGRAKTAGQQQTHDAVQAAGHRSGSRAVRGRFEEARRDTKLATISKIRPPGRRQTGSEPHLVPSGRQTKGPADCPSPDGDLRPFGADPQGRRSAESRSGKTGILMAFGAASQWCGWVVRRVRRTAARVWPGLA